MNELPQPDDDGQAGDLLLRRAMPRAMGANGEVLVPAFVLRPSRSERSLSMYALRLLDSPEAILAKAPAPGWGLILVSVESLQSLGFSVALDPTIADRQFGHAHVSVTPPGYDEAGQIPVALLEAVAAEARWLIRPMRSQR